MPYYETLEEDLKRAKEILARGVVHEAGCPAIADDESDYEHLDDAGRCVCNPVAAGAISGADIYAAYKLLESFVSEIEDYQRSFALYDKASTALMHAYKRAHPEVPEDTWPDTAWVNQWAAQELHDFLVLFSDYEEPCHSYAQAEAIWNSMKGRETAGIEERRRIRELLYQIRTLADEATGTDRSRGDAREVGALGAVKLLVERYKELHLWARMPDCDCRNPVCGHKASQHRGPQGECVVEGCRCGPGGWA